MIHLLSIKQHFFLHLCVTMIYLVGPRQKHEKPSWPGADLFTHACRSGWLVLPCYFTQTITIFPLLCNSILSIWHVEFLCMCVCMCTATYACIRCSCAACMPAHLWVYISIFKCVYLCVCVFTGRSCLFDRLPLSPIDPPIPFLLCKKFMADDPWVKSKATHLGEIMNGNVISQKTLPT